MTRPGLVARVLIESPLPQLDHLFDYGLPEDLAAAAVPGVRVRVPLRSAGRVADGYLIEVVGPDGVVASLNTPDGTPGGSTGAAPGDPPGAAAEPGFHGALSPIDALVSSAAVLTPDVWRLARRVADRAAGNAGDVLRLAVPPRSVRVEKAWLAARTTPPAAQPVTQPAVDGADAAARADRGGAGDRAGPGDRFSGYPAGALETAIRDRTRLSVAAVPDLVSLPGGRTVGHWAVTMADLAVEALRAGRSAILCVPDYRDQDQLQAALAERAPAGSVCRVDARQPGPERYRAFLACLEAVPRIVLGNRSAVYAPAHDLGAILLWDDGDPLHGEPLSPYVHARDAALVRQGQSGCALVFLGHSRSVPVQRLVELGFLGELHPERPRNPRVIPTDFQLAPDRQERANRIPSAAWQAARAALDHGPVLVQVASPGYASSLACQSCTASARCSRCQGPLALGSRDAVPACRWCGQLAAGWRCTHCDGRELRLVSLGTGRTAEELGRAFPGARVVVADGEHPLQQIGADPALVIATRGAEPIPAGGYRAVLLLDGERMLARESLGVGEDCLRWWSNAAALAAPGAPVLLAGVGGAVARALNAWNQAAFAAAELADRRQLRFPPAVRAASVTGTADDVVAALADLTAVAGVDVLGPVTTEAPLVRAIVRFGYADGDRVARLLKAAVVRNASRRRRPAGAPFRQAPTLKVRFDDPELL